MLRDHFGRPVELDAGVALIRETAPRLVFGTFRDVPGRFVTLATWFARGVSCTVAARRAGCTRDTAAKILRFLNAERGKRGLGPFTCPCGRVTTHRGVCKAREHTFPKMARHRARGGLTPTQRARRWRLTHPERHNALQRASYARCKARRVA